MKAKLKQIAVAVAVLGCSGVSSPALIVVTSDPAVAASFQSGATIENFDDLPAFTITSYDSGQTVPSQNQFSSRNLVTFTDPFFNSGGASFNDPVGNPGTPIGIFDPDGAIESDFKSPNNVAGPLSAGTEEGTFQAFNNGFMEVIFPTDMQKVGLWVTHGTFTIFLKDSNNTNLTTGDFEVTGSAGQFIGIERDTPDIRGVTIGFPEAFTFDDFTFAIPEPSSFALAALGLLIFSARRGVRRGR